MDVRKKVLLAGIAIAVLSAAIATQYARVSIAYQYGVSATNGAIRFIARDLAPDGKYVLHNNSNSLILSLGSFTPGTSKTYTAAFGIVNEEKFNIYLYNVTVTNPNAAQYLKIWLHKNPNISAEDDSNAILVWDGNYVNFDNITFYAGNDNPEDASSSNGNILTPFDSNNGIRYNTTSASIGDNNDYWWVQITVNIPNGVSGTYSGNILFKFTSVQ